MFHRPRKLLVPGLIMFVLSALSLWVRADVAYVSEVPSKPMSASEAIKTAKGGKVVFKCQRARVTDAGGIGKAKSAKTLFFTDVKGDDTAQDKIIDGGKGYKCQPLEWNGDRKKLSNASND